MHVNQGSGMSLLPVLFAAVWIEDANGDRSILGPERGELDCEYGRLHFCLFREVVPAQDFRVMSPLLGIGFDAAEVQLGSWT